VELKVLDLEVRDKVEESLYLDYFYKAPLLGLHGQKPYNIFE
jgi:hypothetical protein